ncbi:MAG: PEP-CTERM sorting domain-containing protein [Planctomycetota bacterium]
MSKSINLTLLFVFLCATAAQAEIETFEFSFDLTEAAGVLSVGDTISGSLSYDDSTPIVGTTFPMAITSITFNAGGGSHTFAGTDFFFNDIGPNAAFFVANFTSVPSGGLPFELANFGMGFPSDPSPPGYVANDLTTYDELFPNNFLFQITYDGTDFAEGRGDAALVPEPGSALMILLGMISVFAGLRKRR